MYGITVWGNTYRSTLKPLLSTSTKNAFHIITYFKFDEQTSRML